MNEKRLLLLESEVSEFCLHLDLTDSLTLTMNFRTGRMLDAVLTRYCSLQRYLISNLIHFTVARGMRGRLLNWISPAHTSVASCVFFFFSFFPRTVRLSWFDTAHCQVPVFSYLARCERKDKTGRDLNSETL